MATVQEHYDTHLAPLYSWMSGGAAGPRQRFAELLQSVELASPAPGSTALDLGAGNGFQSIPLAQAGYAVTAVDLSDALLAELARDADGLPIRCVRGDLRDARHYCPIPSPTLIVCMGDTLTHLSSHDDARSVLNEAASLLAPGGHLLLSFRDYSVERTGVDRFIPVRSDETRILTCFLEFNATHIAVHDIVQTRNADGWKTAVSVYQKLRLAPDWVRAQLDAAGLVIVRNTLQNGLVTLAARKPDFS